MMKLCRWFLRYGDALMLLCGVFLFGFIVGMFCTDWFWLQALSEMGVL